MIERQAYLDFSPSREWHARPLVNCDTSQYTDQKRRFSVKCNFSGKNNNSRAFKICFQQHKKDYLVSTVMNGVNDVKNAFKSSEKTILKYKQYQNISLESH